ncbi:hypothetical protein B0I75DRAFT_134036 [Yarrowia lipolytica]|uniref:Uncharacterized protein n=1 Tax=Yarrowia lipolytica TaxID=4952 RepID=A0A371CCP4_YARLL|nr:Hypothetical protein YALI2_A00378g [Yarrowia lipolytica]RDW28043.1 hypothetical protein B0I71DRAFT_127998 [Yarrowia lipolytica]RDW48341.1 hypothetical protein B0I74DRAFT_133730 [Yarrowia lipolytica]RDW54846.1 hypothetical protein B0I75DRAFT_134036 [Yarrowia lipolytica]SEI36015.1 YALIA101S09e04038g1_1 [Yarrowia lipolytica]
MATLFEWFLFVAVPLQLSVNIWGLYGALKTPTFGIYFLFAPALMTFNIYVVALTYFLDQGVGNRLHMVGTIYQIMCVVGLPLNFAAAVIWTVRHGAMRHNIQRGTYETYFRDIVCLKGKREADFLKHREDEAVSASARGLSKFGICHLALFLHWVVFCIVVITSASEARQKFKSRLP